MKIGGKGPSYRLSAQLLLRLLTWRGLCSRLLADPHPPDIGDSNDDGANFGCHNCHDQGAACINAIASPSTENDRKWKWEPTAKSHPCTIRRISRSELHRLYGDEGLPSLYPYPLVIYPDGDDDLDKAGDEFANLTAIGNLRKNFPPDFRVTLTGSDSLSSHRRTVPLEQYLREVLEANDGLGETFPDQLGNETWYLFGETFSREWAEFLRGYRLPPCRSCGPTHRAQNLVALSFGIGNIGSGVQWHLHGPGFSETIHGRKHWVLYPPGRRPQYDSNYASRHWMENTYPVLDDLTDEDLLIERKGHEEFFQRWKNKRDSLHESKRARNAKQAGLGGVEPEQAHSGKKPWECTLHKREMIYFPDQWHHATINLEKYTVFVSSFTTEHENS